MYPGGVWGYHGRHTREAYTSRRLPRASLTALRGQRRLPRASLMGLRDQRRLPRASFNSVSWARRLPRASLYCYSEVKKAPESLSFLWFSLFLPVSPCFIRSFVKTVKTGRKGGRKGGTDTSLAGRSSHLLMDPGYHQGWEGRMRSGVVNT